MQTANRYPPADARGPQAGPDGPNAISGMLIVGDQSLGGFGAGSVVEPEFKADTGLKSKGAVTRQTGIPTGLSFRSNNSGAYRGFRVRFISLDVLISAKNADRCIKSRHRDGSLAAIKP